MRSNDIDAPEGNADDVLRQGEVRLVLMEEAAGGALQQGLDPEQAVEGLSRIHQVAEQEEEHEHQDELVAGQADVTRHFQERNPVILVEHLVQVEHAGRHEQAERDGQDDGDRKQGALDERMRPGHGDEVLVGIVREIRMRLDVVRLHGRDRLQQGQEEDPPDEELDAQQHEAAEGDDARGDQHQQGNPSIGDIPGRQVLLVPEQGPRLGGREDQQQRREDDVQQAVRDERDAEGNDDETEEQDGNVQADSLPDRLPFQPDNERDEDGGQHPGKIHHELRGHCEEVLLGGPAGNHDGQGEDDHAHDERRLETVVGETLVLEEGDLPGKEGDKGKRQDGRNDHVE